MRAEVAYTVRGGERLEVAVTATATAPTPVAPALHLFVNPAGAPGGVGNGSILDDTLRIAATTGLKEDRRGLPTGEAARLPGRYSFFQPRPVVDPGAAGRPARDFDFVYVLSPEPTVQRLVGHVAPPNGTGFRCRMSVLTTEPALRFHSGAGLPTAVGGDHAGLMLSPRRFPGAPNRDSPRGRAATGPDLPPDHDLPVLPALSGRPGRRPPPHPDGDRRPTRTEPACR